MKSVITASFAAVVAVLVLGSHTGHAAPYTYSAAATSSDFFESFNVLVQDTNSAGPAFAEVGSAPALYAKARTAYGVNQAAWQATGQSDQVGALSIWSDQFTFLGGTGTDNVLMQLRVEGVIQSGLFEGAVAILRSEEAPSAAEILAIAAASVSTEPVPPLGSIYRWRPSSSQPSFSKRFRPRRGTAPYGRE